MSCLRVQFADVRRTSFCSYDLRRRHVSFGCRVATLRRRSLDVLTGREKDVRATSFDGRRRTISVYATLLKLICFTCIIAVM